MKKHFLITISNDSEHLFGVRFICSFFSELTEFQVTLLHICRLDSESKTLSSSTMPDGMSNTIPARASRSIKKAKELLRSYDIPVDQVITKTIAERYGKVKDILTASATGLYDTIVLGRRASYTLRWVFEKSADETFQSMIKDSSCVSPIWICPKLEPHRRNVLLCINGSENCFRAVDHVGSMLSSQKQHSINLFHVEITDGNESADYFQRAKKILHGHNISDNQITSTVTWGGSISTAIESEAKGGGYAVVAMGMGKHKRDVSSRLTLNGKTTKKLISSIEKSSLWCYP